MPGLPEEVSLAAAHDAELELGGRSGGIQAADEPPVMMQRSAISIL